MALSIKSAEADRLARELTRLTGETLTQAIEEALRQRLQREAGKRSLKTVREEVARMQERVRNLERKQQGSDEALIGYDERGLPA